MKITRQKIKSRKKARKPSVNERGETPKQELERLRKMSHETFYLRGFYEQVLKDVEKIVSRKLDMAVAEIVDDIIMELKP